MYCFFTIIFYHNLNCYSLRSVFLHVCQYIDTNKLFSISSMLYIIEMYFYKHNSKFFQRLYMTEVRPGSSFLQGNMTNSGLYGKHIVRVGSIHYLLTNVSLIIKTNHSKPFSYQVFFPGWIFFVYLMVIFISI